MMQFHDGGNLERKIYVIKDLCNKNALVCMAVGRINMRWKPALRMVCHGRYQENGQ